MIITELLEKLGKFNIVHSTKRDIWRGFYVVNTITDNEINLLKEYLQFEHFSIQHFILGNTNELRFHIEFDKQKIKELQRRDETVRP